MPRLRRSCSASGGLASSIARPSRTIRRYTFTIRPPEALHDLRKRGKELRYLLELFGGAFQGEVVEETVKALKGLQTVLGRYQDRAVQLESLRALRDELAAEPEGPAALIALGPALEHLRADQRAAREEFAERFGAFAAKPRREVVRAAFGGAAS